MGCLNSVCWWPPSWFVCCLQWGAPLGFPPFGSLKDWDIALKYGLSPCITNIVQSSAFPCLHWWHWSVGPLILMALYSVNLGLFELQYCYLPGGSSSYFYDNWFDFGYLTTATRSANCSFKLMSLSLVSVEFSMDLTFAVVTDGPGLESLISVSAFWHTINN